KRAFVVDYSQPTFAASQTFNHAMSAQTDDGAIVIEAMRALVVADIHANLPAFEAVIADAERQGGFEMIWCLGDVVGDGPQPRECIEKLRSYAGVCIAGNHDLAVAGEVDLSEFNPFAAAAVTW